MKLEELTATPLDLPVTWARHPDDTGWRTSGIDRLLRWNGAAWCARRPRGMLTEYLDPVHTVVEHRGRLLGVHPDGYGLVMEETRMLTLIPLGGLRVELAPRSGDPDPARAERSCRCDQSAGPCACRK